VCQLRPFHLGRGFLPSLSALALTGCLYGFAGGGLPSDIKTVAVLPFDNLTPEPTLTQEISDKVREAVQGRLGLRQAGEASADAIVRGSITRYEPDLPVAYTGTTVAQGQPDSIDVTKRLVQITVSVEILDQHRGKTLWQATGLTLEGDYAPGSETEKDGREKALDKLVTNIVDGAQSQW
jgi:Lipopolysaccharide-assembly